MRVVKPLPSMTLNSQKERAIGKHCSQCRHSRLVIGEPMTFECRRAHPVTDEAARSCADFKDSRVALPSLWSHIQ